MAREDYNYKEFNLQLSMKTQQEIQLTSTEPGEVLYDPIIHGDSVVYVWVSMISSIVYGMHLTYQ